MDKLRSIEPINKADRPRTVDHLDLDCPPLPHTLFEAMEILNKPGATTHDRVSEMVHNDPLVVVRLLRIVNSPYYGFTREIESADRAVRLLGPHAVASIVMNMNVAQLQTILEGPAAKTLERLIHHGVATSRLSQALWELLSPGSGSQEASTAGLLHDFGKVVLLYNYPQQAAELYDSEEERDDGEWLEAESSLFGCNHLEAGERIADRLAFPAGTMSVIRRAYAENTPLNTVVAAADVAARTLGFYFQHPLSGDECKDHPIWDELATTFPKHGSDKPDLLRHIYAQTEDVARFALQLLPKQSDRAPLPSKRNRKRAETPARGPVQPQ